FLAARRAAAGLDDYPGDFPASLEDAYAIQDEAIARWNKPVIGWKIGRVLAPLAERYGTDRLSGPIFNRKDAPANGEVGERDVFVHGFAAGEAVLCRGSARRRRKRRTIPPSTRRPI